MKRFLLYILLLPFFTLGQVPINYYLPAYAKQGQNLLVALHNIIKDHYVVPTASISSLIQRTDSKANGKVWDIYGYVPNGPQNYEYTFGTMACGTPIVESDCYDLEYVWPKNWFANMPTPSNDLFNIYPADGVVKNNRALFPYGTAMTTTYLSLNGSKLGMSSDIGYTGTVFEPINDIKGDIARTFFYMATRYYSEDIIWSSSSATNKSTILPWQMSVLLSWNHSDPVSDKERDRNDTIFYKLQGNRNPFIDRPQFADTIWTAYIGLKEQNVLGKENYSLFPNPSKGKIKIAGVSVGDNVQILNLLGQVMHERECSSFEEEFVTTSFSSGPYILRLRTNFNTYYFRFINSP